MLHFNAKVPDPENGVQRILPLYDCVIKLEADETIYSGAKIGFRSVENKECAAACEWCACLCGEGVNRHEHDDVKGHVPARELMLKDIRLMKEFNISTVSYPSLSQ